MLLTYVAAVVVAFLLLRWLRRYLAYRAIFNNLPGLEDFRILTGNLHLHPGLGEKGVLFELENARKFQYFYRFWMGPFLPTLTLFHPDVIKPIMKSQAPKPRSKWYTNSYDMGLRWLGEGLLIANGDRWARSRRLLTPAFHFDILKPYMDVYNTCTDILTNKMLTLSKKGKSIEIYNLINLEALDIILRCAFSYKSDCQTVETQSDYIKAISELQQMWSQRCLEPLFLSEFIYGLSKTGRRFYHLCDIAHKASEEIIEKRRKELEDNPNLVSTKKVKDFLDTLLTARDEDGKGLSPLELRNEVDTFLFEGHDTTASAITWTLYSLAGHPEYQQKMYEELVEKLGDKNNVDWNDLSELEYTTMCIKEAMRLHGPVPMIERTTTEEVIFNGHKIPIGTRVILNLHALHNNPHVWDDPQEYRPERFHPDRQREQNPFQYVPFSAGSRNCIGQSFAFNEMKTTVAKVIKKFKLTIDTDHEVPRMASVTMKPVKGVYLYVTPRT